MRVGSQAVLSLARQALLGCGRLLSGAFYGPDLSHGSPMTAWSLVRVQGESLFRQSFPSMPWSPEPSPLQSLSIVAKVTFWHPESKRTCGGGERHQGSGIQWSCWRLCVGHGCQWDSVGMGHWPPFLGPQAGHTQRLHVYDLGHCFHVPIPSGKCRLVLSQHSVTSLIFFDSLFQSNVGNVASNTSTHFLVLSVFLWLISILLGFNTQSQHDDAPHQNSPSPFPSLFIILSWPLITSNIDFG